MSNDKPNAAPPKPPQSIPCRVLYLGTKRLKPDGNVSDVITADTSQMNKARFTIEYMPALQFYRVAYFGPSATEPTKVMMYPREWAAFEPVPM